MTYIVKPCPFCGIQMQDSDADDYLHTNPWFAGKRELGVYWSINCLEHAGGCGVQMLGDTEEEVISKWNRRVFGECDDE